MTKSNASSEQFSLESFEEKMAKIPKQPSVENPNSSISSSSDNRFTSLTAGTQEEEPNNPTPIDDQSIPQKLQQILQLQPETNIPESSNYKSNKRKRKEKLHDCLDSDDDTEIEVEIKKSKREIGPDLVITKGSNFDEKKKKKRKRVEIEAEYEERKYGVMDLDLDLKEEKVKIGEKRKKLDVEEDMFVSIEGFDDEEKLLRTIIVGNLPLKVNKKELMREFSQFGEIESVRIQSIPLLNDNTPRKGVIIKKQVNDAIDRGNAYIVFNSEESAQASLSHNMAVVGGNHIQVHRACPPRKKLKGDNCPFYDNTRAVFIGNLPLDVKDQEIYQLFDEIEAIRIVRDPNTSLGNCIAYVLFNTREAANKVVRKHKAKIRDTGLSVSRVIKSNPTLSKRKDPPSSSNEHYSSNKKLAVGQKDGHESC